MAAHRVEKITDVPFEPAQPQPYVQVEEQVLQESFVQPAFEEQALQETVVEVVDVQPTAFKFFLNLGCTNFI